jgi:hypothetical protein
MLSGCKNVSYKVGIGFVSSVSAVVLLFIYSFTKFDSSVGQTHQTMVTMGLLCWYMFQNFASFHVR